MFKNLKTLKGTTMEEFDLLKHFKQTGKRVPELKWTIPQQEAGRNTFDEFLQFDQPESLKLVGGWLDTITINNFHFGKHTKKLTFKDMPSVKISAAFTNLPQLTHFDIENCDQFTKEDFMAAYSHLVTYAGLQHLGFTNMYMEMN